MGAIVVIAASAGGLRPLRRIIVGLPIPCTASVFVVMHLGRYSNLPTLLARDNLLPATFAQDRTLIESGHIYVAPPDYHMSLRPSKIRLSHGPKVHHTRPAADPLFVSAAKSYGEMVIGVVLSGAGRDGAIGLRTIKDHGGTALVQHPDDAAVPDMPFAAIAAVHTDACLPVEELMRLVGSLCSRYRTLPSHFHH